MISSTSSAILGIIFGYVALCIFIGWFAYRKRGAGIRDFYVASGSIGPVIMAGTIAATGYSAYAVLGGPGWAYTGGVGPPMSELPYMFGNVLVCLVVGARIFKAGVYHEFITPADFFAKRFREEWITRIIVGFVICFLGSIFYISAQLIGSTYVITGLSGGELKYLPILIVMAITLVVYVALGGFRAVAYTDFMQAVMMTLLIVGMAIVAIKDFGGVSQLWASAIDKHPAIMTLDTPHRWFVTYGLMAFLGPMMFPHLWVRLYANRSLEGLRSMAIGGLMAGVLVVIFSYTTMGATISATFPDAATAPGPADQLPVFWALGRFGPILGAVLFTGAMAAAFSTADSILLMVSSSFSKDILGLFNWPKTEKNQMATARFLIVAVIGISLIGGLNPQMGLIKMVMSLTYPLYYMLMPVTLLGLFWRKTNKYGVGAGLITGATITLLVIAGVIPTYGFFNGFIGICTCAVVIVVVSLLTPSPSKQELSKFFIEQSKVTT